MVPTGIAFFDLDHTLLDGDSDSSFIDFLGQRGLLSAALVASKDPISEAYMQGRPWQADYRAFLQRVYEGRSLAEMESIAAEHAAERGPGLLYPGARALVETQRARHRSVALLTTTNQIVSAPIAASLGIDVVLSTLLETRDGLFTGRVVGDFCTGPGKAVALREHCLIHGVDPMDCSMFGDGRSDMDALGAVGQPVAVHPNDELARHAALHGWPILDLR